MGRLVVFQSILEPFEPQEVLTFQPSVLDGPLYIQEAYCSNPLCDCQEAYLAFHLLNQDGKPIEELFRFCLDLVKKVYDNLQIMNTSFPISDIIDEFMTNIDLFIEDLANHYRRVKDYYRHYIPEERLPLLYKSYERKQYVQYHDLFSGDVLVEDGLLILDTYRLDEEEEPTAQLQLVHGEEEPSTIIVNIPRRTYRVISGCIHDRQVEKILNVPIYKRIKDHCALIKEAGQRVAKAGMRLGKIGRNAPCPCGSGKKFKFCHGRVI